MFKSLEIQQDLVPVALTALDKHSQNDMLYNPETVKSMPEEEMKLANDIFHWAGLPFDTKNLVRRF